MQVNIEIVRHANSGSQSDSTASDLRRRGWLLHLEQAMLERRQPSSDTDISGNDNVSVKCGESATGAQQIPPDAGASSALNQEHIAVMSGPVHADGQTEQSGTGATSQCLSDGSRQSVGQNMTESFGDGFLTYRTSLAILAFEQAGKEAGFSTVPASIESVSTCHEANVVAEYRPLASVLQIAPVAVMTSVSTIQMNQTEDVSNERSSSSRTFNGTNGFRNVDVGSADLTNEYSRRMVHFYYDGESVQTWIRDAALALPDMEALGRLLSQELREAGQKIAQVTINGRTVVRAGDGNWRERVVLNDSTMDDPRANLRKLHIEGQTI